MPSVLTRWWAFALAAFVSGCPEEEELPPHPPPGQTTIASGKGESAVTSDGTDSTTTTTTTTTATTSGPTTTGATTTGATTTGATTTGLPTTGGTLGPATVGTGPGTAGTGGIVPYGPCNRGSCFGAQVCTGLTESPTGGICSPPCLVDADCVRPQSGDADPFCVPHDQGLGEVCRLDCSLGQTCPSGAVCLGAWCNY